MSGETKTYKIVTGSQEITYVEADRAEKTSGGYVDLYLGEDWVASFIGYSGFNVVNPSIVPSTESEEPADPV